MFLGINVPQNENKSIHKLYHSQINNMKGQKLKTTRI